MNKSKCKLCGKILQVNEVSHGESLSPDTLVKIMKDTSTFGDSDTICFRCLNGYRAKRIEELLAEEKGKLSQLEKEVIESIRDQEIITDDVNKEFETKQSLSEKLSDRIAEFGGSWKFIISFGIFIAVWVVFNSIQLLKNPIDPFPFILLNLFLSCMTTLQAPIIMMSQNRQSSKDRLKAEMDYQVNLKAELQTRAMNRKLDQFMSQQWQKFLEIQELQHQISNSAKSKAPKKLSEY